MWGRSFPSLLVIAAICFAPIICKAQAQVTAEELYKRSSPSVVLIENYDEKGEVSSAASGFLVGSNGTVLTNYHVIAHSKRASVRLANGDAYDDVQVLDIDKRKDIALIKIKAVGLPVLSLGRSGVIEVGDAVFCLGNPLGVFQNTLSQGIVSGIRQGDGYHYFQISAPISHGSSGGPIFNSRGEVIALAVATASEGQNLNFAVPIDYAAGMLDSKNPKSLASIYEPEQENEPPAKADGQPGSSQSSSQEVVKAQPSAGYKNASFAYIEGKLGVWTPHDAEVEFGSPHRRRDSYSNGTADGDIYAYTDPTFAFREVELNFARSTNTLTAMYAYPWSLTWAQCKQLWGDDVKTTKNNNGTRFYAYKNRRLAVLVDNLGRVINLGVW